MSIEETPRQRFLRNHQENVRIMRAAALRAEREGSPDAATIREIAEAWGRIGDKAQDQETQE